MKKNKKKILVTGGTSGIGLATVKSFFEQGHSIYITFRDKMKIEKVYDLLETDKSNARISFFECDMSEPKQIKLFANNLKRKKIEIDCLVNNAGTILFDKSFNSEGIETTFATNHLGYFYLTNLLLKQNTIKRPGRIINVGSSAHLGNSIDFKDLDNGKTNNWYKRYGRSKLCNLLFTFHLAKLLKGFNISVNCVHPGLVYTNIGQNRKTLKALILKIILYFRGIKANDGADTIVFLALNDEVENISGKYFINRKIAKTSKEALDAATSKRLWKESEKIIEKL